MPVAVLPGRKSQLLVPRLRGLDKLHSFVSKPKSAREKLPMSKNTYKVPKADAIKRVRDLLVNPSMSFSKGEERRLLTPALKQRKKQPLFTDFTEPLFEEDYDCNICLENAPYLATSELRCRHSFHTSCLQRWFHKERIHPTCPTCRSVPSFSELSL